MKKYIAILAVTLLSACGGKDKSASAEETKKDEPLAKSQNSTVFDDKFSQLLDQYYHLKDALVLTNDELAATSATNLASAAKAVNLKEMKADTTVLDMANENLDSIAAYATRLGAAKDIESKRAIFRDLSESLYQLTLTVHYDKQVVYHQFCPMAFNNEGAYWLNSTDDIKNPYFGKKMLSCGETKDSIDFRAK